MTRMKKHNKQDPKQLAVPVLSQIACTEGKLYALDVHGKVWKHCPHSFADPERDQEEMPEHWEPLTVQSVP